MIRFPALFAVAAIVAGYTPDGSLMAQEATVSLSSSCTYDTCALRLETRRLVRGIQGEKVASLGTFRHDKLVPLVSNVVGMSPAGDSALAYARVFDREFPRARTMFWGGALAAGIPLALTLGPLYDDDSATKPSWGMLAAAAPGFIIELIGARKMQRAYEAHSRAIWWYNRDLPR